MGRYTATWRGDINLWNEAKRHILEAPHTTEEEREIISLSLAIIDSSVYDNKDYPTWFTIGNFEALPADSHPAAKVFYVKYLYMGAFALASKQLSMEGITGLSLMRMIPNTIEPLITQAVVDKTVLPEILLRMSCAVAYHNAGMKEQALLHINKAVALALKDKLYGTLTEREREVAKLAAFGFKTPEIAAMLYLSESTIKQTITRVLNKTGLTEKKSFIAFFKLFKSSGWLIKRANLFAPKSFFGVFTKSNKSCILFMIKKQYTGFLFIGGKYESNTRWRPL